MLVLVISLISLIPADGDWDELDVTISPGSGLICPVGAHFNLSCTFTFLTSNHYALMWINYNSENQECLINITSTKPNVTMGLNIQFATAVDAGIYSCSTFPPEVHSLQIPIVINGSQGHCEPVSTVEVKETVQERQKGHQRQDSLPTPSALTTQSSQKLCSTDQYSSEAGDNSGLWGQMWYWMLLGKAAILLLSLASLAVKCKRG